MSSSFKLSISYSKLGSCFSISYSVPSFILQQSSLLSLEELWYASMLFILII